VPERGQHARKLAAAEAPESPLADDPLPPTVRPRARAVVGLTLRSEPEGRILLWRRGLNLSHLKGGREGSGDLAPTETYLDTRELALEQGFELGGVVAIEVQALADFAGDGHDPRRRTFRGEGSSFVPSTSTPQ
jgi:hypothetical protein